MYHEQIATILACKTGALLWANRGERGILKAPRVMQATPTVFSRIIAEGD